MRRHHGVVDSAGGLVPFGHLGWGYRSRPEFLARAAEYIADGLNRNQWVEYVGAGSREQLRAELDAMPIDTTRVTATPALEFYGVAEGTDIVDADVAVAIRVAAVVSAFDRGYTGFRAVVDATAVTQRPEQRDEFARFEFLIDQKMATLPVSALCAYDITRLAGDADGLLCLHPLVGPGAPTFRLYAEPGVALVLDGEVDAASSDTFTTTLQRIWPVTGDGQLVVDAAGMYFIGHHQLLELDNLAARDGRQVVLRGCGPLLTRLAGLLELANLRIEPA